MERKVLRAFNLRFYDKDLNDKISELAKESPRKLNEKITAILKKHFKLGEEK